MPMLERRDLEALGFRVEHGKAVRITATTGPTTEEPYTPRYRSKLEAQRAIELAAMVRAGDLRRVEYEAVSLRLGHARWYRPDFWLVRPDGSIEIEEVKGQVRGREWERGGTKLHVAARLYPELACYLVRRIGGQFTRIRIRSR